MWWRGYQVVIDEMRASVGQFGAFRLNDLRKLDIRHENAINFERQSEASNGRCGNIWGNISQISWTPSAPGGVDAVLAGSLLHLECVTPIRRLIAGQFLDHLLPNEVEIGLDCDAIR